MGAIGSNIRMEPSCFRLITCCVVVSLLSGCGDAPQTPDRFDEKYARDFTNEPTLVSQVPEKVLTGEQIQLRSAREYLDQDDYYMAMRYARGLMKSQDVEIIKGILDIFGWIGRKALPEIEEFLSSEREEIATFALQHWEMAIEEISNERIKAICVTNAAAHVKRKDVIDAVLMHISSVESRVSLPALEGLILSERGKPCSFGAKEMFEHISGESWNSPERTKVILKFN